MIAVRPILSGRARRGKPAPRAVAGGRTRRWWLLLCPLLASCQPDDTVPPGARVHPTIVSLNPCGDAILADVTAPGQLLAVSHYSHDPGSSSMGVDKARAYRSVSGSVEEIAALAPDVVVADVFLPPNTRQGLQDLGIRVVFLGTTDSIATSLTQVRELSAKVGRAGAGERLVSRIETALAKAAPPPGTAAIPAIMWEPGGIVAGDRTLIADILRRTGFANAAAARGLGQADYLPLEVMLAHPPRVILSASGSPSDEDRLLSHPALGAMSGVRTARFPNALLWCGGPTIIRAAQRLAEVRHGLGHDPIRATGM